MGASTRERLMVGAGLNRHARRELVARTRQQAKTRPARMTQVACELWPPSLRDAPESPSALWQSRNFLAQLYEAPNLGDLPCLRLSICRTRITTVRVGREPLLG